MYKQYEDSTLKKLQKTELSILKDFQKIAKENNIEYFAIGGTAIGAVRHGGFIPWDDDIDICISRNDYKKLSKIIEENYSHKYTMLSAKTDDHYPILEGHMQLNGTKFVDESSKDLKCDMGIFLDFFIYDNISDDIKERKKQIHDCKFWGKILILRDMAFPVLPIKGFAGKIIHLITALIHLVLVLFNVSHNKLYKKVTEASTRFNNIKTENVALFRDLYIEESMMKVNDIFPLKTVKFEDTEIKIPNNNHYILTLYYGDYMKVPSKDKRVNHAPIVLDFGNWGSGNVD